MLHVIAISLGASVGALVRWQVSLWLNQGHAVLPWGTLAANWIGAWLVGVAVVFFQSQTQLDPAWRLAIITGFLGGLTTFSTFSAEVVSMLQHARYLLAFGRRRCTCWVRWRSRCWASRWPAPGSVRPPDTAPLTRAPHTAGCGN